MLVIRLLDVPVEVFRSGDEVVEEVSSPPKRFLKVTVKRVNSVLLLDALFVALECVRKEEVRGTRIVHRFCQITIRICNVLVVAAGLGKARKESNVRLRLGLLFMPVTLRRKRQSRREKWYVKT